MDLRIGGRVALVTGASRGLGEAVAQALAREGVRLAVAARDIKALEAVVKRARQSGAADARAFAVDLNDESAIERLLRDVRSVFGDVQILVANTPGPKSATYTEVALEEWDAGYRSVMRAVLQLVNGVLPAMRAGGWGRIVALASTSVKQPIATLVLSNAFRVALVAALKTLAIEVARDGVTVNAIATGRVLTDHLRELYGGDDAALRRAAQEVPIGRLATPEEFAPMTAFLCGEPASYVTGQTIAVDGGLIASLF
jgi:3-oxoacyl-[acyl-carrier protein] reductase